LKGGPIKLLEANTSVVRTSDPAISEIQSRLGYEDDTWEFICALFGTTFMDPDEGAIAFLHGSEDTYYVTNEDLYFMMTE
jgi:hypothetical protein